MPEVKVRFPCSICKKTITLTLSEEFQSKFIATADKWPYPMLYPHDDHWVVVYLDNNFHDRGAITSKIVFRD